jgi:hypothetical protein
MAALSGQVLMGRYFWTGFSGLVFLDWSFLDGPFFGLVFLDWPFWNRCCQSN